MYKQIYDELKKAVGSVSTASGVYTIVIPLSDLVNTDYANFKAQINADEARLQDADGNIMSAEDAKAFVATLP